MADALGADHGTDALRSHDVEQQENCRMCEAVAEVHGDQELQCVDCGLALPEDQTRETGAGESPSPVRLACRERLATGNGLGE